MVVLSVDRVVNPAERRHGGLAGTPGRIRISEDGPDLPGKGEFRVKAGQRLRFQTPGGGGFGKPEERDPARLARDVEEGNVSMEAARTVYGKPA